ncbi:uncharacterized protein LOC106157601 [Lingula anatina]|uniref:Uncharacterized protein LOC106157601 n=1 Tax=Lingula anatina TaxID=7574 RepID=A0A1S3HT71_LINAN|nr:uncharacterized protein LOC106157601 [Lingula anatina]|eukprot:XP_013388761.1 uncharacterized protein LOC106157601 [Lingula anatina]
MAEWGFWLRFIGLPFVIIMGLCGNCTAFLVMCFSPLRKHSYSYYLAALAVFDTWSLVIRSLHWINLLQQLRGRPPLVVFESTLSCKLSEYLFTAVHICCSWLIVLIAMERHYVVSSPLQARKNCTPKVSRAAVGCLALAALMIEIYAAVLTDYRPGLGCGMTDSYIVWHYVIATSFVSMLPLILILLCNIHITYLLHRLDYITNIFRNDHKTKRVTYMLLMVSVAFIILVMPNALLGLILTIRVDWIPHLVMLAPPFNLLWDINFSINFFIYVISGVEVRRELRGMCCSPCRGSEAMDMVSPKLPGGSSQSVHLETVSGTLSAQSQSSALSAGDCP